MNGAATENDSSKTPEVAYEHVSFTYPGRNGNAALSDICLRVEPGERLGIFGPNGAGKSTLLMLTMGLLRGYSGTIRVFGMPPRQASTRRLIGYVPQRSRAERAFPLSVRQVVRMPAQVGLGLGSSMSRGGAERVADAMELVGVEDLADAPIGSLSSGQFQRVMIARSLACRPRILILDEPTVGVDMDGQRRFADLLGLVHDRLELTIMIVTHDLRTIAAGCDRVACLAKNLHAHVSPEGLTPKVLAEIFSHDIAGMFGDVHVDAHRAESCPETCPAHRDRTRNEGSDGDA